MASGIDNYTPPHTCVSVLIPYAFGVVICAFLVYITKGRIGYVLTLFAMPASLFIIVIYVT